MKWAPRIVPVCLLVVAAALCADGPDSSVGGLKLVKVPEAVRAHLPKLQEDQGILIEKVAVDSLGKQIGFEPHDIIVSIGGIALKDADHFGRLLVALGDNSKVSIIRKGQAMSLALKLKLEDLPKGLAKNTGLPDVTIKCQMVGKDQYSLHLRFYTEGGGKLQEIPLDGSLAEIEKKVADLASQRRMSDRVVQFVETALDRLRTINKTPPK